MNLSIEEESAMNWMGGFMAVSLSIIFTIAHFLGTEILLCTAIGMMIGGFFKIFYSIKQIKFANRDK